MADGQVILLDPGEELAAVDLVAADGQHTAILAGELGQELRHRFVQASR
jgi:hypothetical protein